MKNNQDWKRILPGLVISALALAVVLYFADLSQVIEALRLADYRLVILVFVLTSIWVAVRGMVWRTLLQEQATFKQTFFTVSEGYLINNVLPLRLGELARAFLLSRKANLGFWQVFSTILIERALDMMMAAGFLLATLPFVVNASWALQAAVGAGLLVLLGLASLYLLARNQEWARRQFQRISQRWPALEKMGSKHLNAFLTGLSVLTNGKRFLSSVMWVLVNWGFALLQYYILILAFAPQAEPLWAAFTLGVVALGAAAPSSPGALGVMEASTVGALSAFGLDPSISLAIALTGHAANYIVTGILGSYALVMDGISLTGIYRQVKDIAPEDSD